MRVFNIGLILPWIFFITLPCFEPLANLTWAADIENGLFIGLNGNPCAYFDFSAALTAASDGDLLYIDRGTHLKRMGIINKNVTFLAATGNCTQAAAGGVTIDAGQTPTTFGGVAEIAANQTVTFKNLVLANGNAVLGGILYGNSGSTVILDNTTLTGGTADAFGGAVRIYSGSVLHLINGSRILKNTSLEDGGGIAVYQGTVNLINALIGENTAGNNGGGLILEAGTLVIVNSSIVNNDAFWNGGGLAASSNSSLTVKTQFPLSGSEVPNGLQASPCVIPLLPPDHYCTEFRDNRAGNHGGGLHLDRSGAAISHTAFIGNVASRGAAFVLRAGSLSLSQALIRDQVATDTSNPDVGWVYTEEAGETAALEAVHTTWAGNTGTAVRYEGDAGGLFNNNIVWGNSARGSITPAASAGCNNTQDGALDGPDNLCLDPRFATTSRGGYRLLLDSPSLDACSTGTTPDLDGRIRPRGAAYDMGAFEGGTAFLYLPLVFRN